MAEFEIIEKYFKALAKGDKAARNLEDDSAQFALKNNCELVVSKDIFVEDTHFLLADGGYKIAQKLLITNLSDLAASGATPLYYMLGFGKSKNIDEKFIAEFCQGLGDLQKKFKIKLIGGDTSAAKQAFFSITVFGYVKKNQNLARFNAKENDLIFVSGNIGDAYRGLQIKLGEKNNYTKSQKEYFLNRHFFPTPRLSLGQNLLAKKLSKCAIDISDGLLADLRHICRNSNLSAKIFLDKIPFCEKNLPLKEQLKLMSGGDDYELLFTVDCKNERKIINLAKKLNLRLSCIGSLTHKQKDDIALFNSQNQQIKLTKFGYEHF